MFRPQQINMDWQVGEEAYQNTLQLQNVSEAFTSRPLIVPDERWVAVQLLRGLLFFGLALLLVGSFARTPREAAWMQAQAGIYHALTLEAEAWQSDDRTVYDSLVDATVDADLRATWHDSWRVTPDERDDYGTTILNIALPNVSLPSADAAPNLIVADMLITRPSLQWWRSSPYRETRFYRRAGQSWIRTLPPNTYWGTKQSLATAHLRFEYVAHDAEMVESITDRLETIYVTMYDYLGRDAPLAGEKLTFEIVPDSITNGGERVNRRVLTSPALARVPADLSDADFLAHMIVSHMTNEALYGSARRSGRPYLFRWETMYWSLNGWLRTELLAQRSPWHQQAADYFRVEMPDQPIPLSEIVTYWMDARATDQAELMRQYIMAESIIAYAVAEFGRASLPRLIEGLRTEGSWETLIESSFNITAEAFEVGWNRYLNEHYR